MASNSQAPRADESALFATQLLRAEQQKAALSAVFMGGIATAATLAFTLTAPTFEALGDANGVRYWIPVILALGAAYEWGVSRSLGRLALQKGRLPAWLGYLNVLVETTVVTGVLAVVTRFAAPAGALSAPPVAGYSLVAILAALRLDARLCLFAGALAALQYGALSAWHWQALEKLGEGAVFGTANLYLARSLALATMGAAGAFVAREIRRRTTHTIEQMQERERAVRVFGRYLDDDVVDTLLRSPENLALGGQTRTVTIMMTDLRGFTSLSERLSASDVITVLNHFLGEMTEIVRRHRGTIDEFIGDAILGIFGAPFEGEDDATRAVACALEMQNAMPEINRWNKEHGFPGLEMGIGLNTGEVIVGNIGSERRSKYGVVGSQVNLTSRIESYTVGGQILISQTTREAVGPVLTTGEGREVQPKGVKEAIRIFEVKALGGEYGLEAHTHLPPLKSLVQERGVRIRLVEGKDIGEKFWEGSLVRISTLEAEVRCPRAFRPLDNLRFEAITDLAGEAFAKVVGPGESDGAFKVRFTAREEALAAEMNTWAVL
jgi:class 3 adenylate cyclase